MGACQLLVAIEPMRQARTVVYIEFYRDENTGDIDSKIHKAFPENVKRTFVGVDYKNFGYGRVDEITQAEVLASGAQSTTFLMKCSNCSHTWSACGYTNSKGKFLLEGSDICELCKGEGMRIE